MRSFESSPLPPYKEQLIGARNARAVKKIEFVTQISRLSKNSKVFVFEGVDDKCVYHHWILRVNPEISYESLVARTKLDVLHLFDSLCDDATGLNERVFFFVDRDFDGLQGRAGHPSLFVTDRYSIENYAVCSKVLDAVLVVDFHCNGLPELRREIVKLFEQDYSRFLEVTCEANFRIFVSRRAGIPQIAPLPERINQLALVEIGRVVPCSAPPETLIKLAEEPSEDQLVMLRSEFRKFSPKHDYRGKFGLVFFLRWLELLRQERLKESGGLFEDAPRNGASVFGGFSLAHLASKAHPPAGLANFVARAAASCSRNN